MAEHVEYARAAELVCELTDEGLCLSWGGGGRLVVTGSPDEVCDLGELVVAAGVAAVLAAD